MLFSIARRLDSTTKMMVVRALLLLRSTLLVSSFEDSVKIIGRSNPPLLVLLLRRRRRQSRCASSSFDPTPFTSRGASARVHRQSRRRRLLCAKGPSSPLTPKVEEEEGDGGLGVVAKKSHRCSLYVLLLSALLPLLLLRCLQRRSLSVCVCMYSLSRALSRECIYIAANEIWKKSSKLREKRASLERERRSVVVVARAQKHRERKESRICSL